VLSNEHFHSGMSVTVDDECSSSAIVLRARRGQHRPQGIAA
jgi:hypothetical protein